MFDVGFTEIVLISGVALLVLGPDKLPGAIRTLGLWIGRLRRSFNNIKADIEREVGADEIRRQLRNEAIMDKLKNTKTQFTQSVDSVKKQADSVKKDMNLENEFSSLSDKKKQDAQPPESVQTDEGKQLPEDQQNSVHGSPANPAGAGSAAESPVGQDSSPAENPAGSGDSSPASAEPRPARPAAKAETESAPASVPNGVGENPPASESTGTEPQKPSEQK